MLEWDGPDTILLWIEISTVEGLTPESMVDYWASQEYMDELADPDAEVLLKESDDQSGGVILRDYWSVGEEVTIVMEATVLQDGEHLAIVTIMSYTETIKDAVDDADADVSLVGGDLLDTFRVRDVSRALEN